MTIVVRRSLPNRAGLALMLDAFLGRPVRHLFLQSHGSYEAALDRIVWGLDQRDDSRWAEFPVLLTFPGVDGEILWRELRRRTG